MIYRSFKDFKAEVAPKFPHPRAQALVEEYSINHTQKPHLNWGTDLYSFEWKNCYIAYTSGKRWRFYLDGVWGEGESASEACEDHAGKYEEHCNALDI